MATYKIIRFYQDPNLTVKTIRTGLTLNQAKGHCSQPSSKGYGWFDGFTEEK
jgi:hypothetical protein